MTKKSGVLERSIKHTSDVVITGYEPGKGKYAGTVGAIVFGQYLRNGGWTTLGTCSGMDDKLRRSLSHEDLGKVIEIEHCGREPSGAFRHPQFKRFRPDKDPESCIYYEGEQ